MAGKGNIEIVAVAVVEQPAFTGMHIVAAAMIGMATGGALLILPLTLGWY